MKDRQCDFVEAFALEQKYLHFHSYMPVSWVIPCKDEHLLNSIKITYNE
jgi:hypothetical protein